MRPHLRFMLTVLCGAGLATGVLVNSARADQWDKKTTLTVNQPIQVKDNLLPPGTYVFKLLNSSADRHIVQIFNSDQSRIIDTVLAVPNYRLEPTGDSKFAFWETPPGNAKALRAWFYPGDNFGQEFPYPKHFIQLEASAATTSTTPSYEPPPVVTQPAEPAVTQQESETRDEVKTEEVPREEPPVQQEMAQATPPQPATPAPPPPQPSEDRTMPRNLPKTSTPYPLIGLSGLVSLGLFGLLRLKRTA